MVWLPSATPTAAGGLCGVAEGWDPSRGCDASSACTLLRSFPCRDVVSFEGGRRGEFEREGEGVNLKGRERG